MKKINTLVSYKDEPTILYKCHHQFKKKHAIFVTFSFQFFYFFCPQDSEKRLDW